MDTVLPFVVISPTIHGPVFATKLLLSKQQTVRLVYVHRCFELYSSSGIPGLPLYVVDASRQRRTYVCLYLLHCSLLSALPSCGEVKGFCRTEIRPVSPPMSRIGSYV